MLDFLMEGEFWIKYSSIILLLVIQLQGFNGCVEEEKLGLLKIKALFNSCGNESFNPLPSWVDYGVSDCCRWERVECESITGSVLELSLGGLLSNFTNSHCFLNVSLFQPFGELKSLNLSYNWFSGLVELGGCEGLSGLKGLEILDLGFNNFSNSIISSLNGLISIKTLILRSNELEDSIPSYDLAKFRNLETLDLSRNGFFDGSISLEDLRNLRVLDLSNNKFNGTLPILGLCEKNSLLELDISMNNISDELPQCLSNWTNLRFLDISSNLFRGKLQHIISSLTSLEYLSLANNHFDGLFSFSSLANHSKLKVFQLSSRDKQKLQVETEDSKWSPTFQLKVLSLPNVQLNRQTTSQIPSFLSSQYDLQYLDLANNELIGRFPIWLLQKNSKLEYINLTNNSFSGNLQFPSFKHDLLRLQLSSNEFSGQLPDNIGLVLPNVLFINISRNNFEGTLPSSIGEMQKVCVLDLSHNNFSGKVPISMFSNMLLLECLLLENNHFSGSIEDRYSNNTVLTVLDISNNLVSGRIPSWIGRLSNIKVLQMSKNLLEGELPAELCSLQNLVFLDLSQNQLFGFMPSCFNLSSLNYLYLQENNLSGLIPCALSRSKYLITIDLSRNKLSGEIPYWFNDFRRLQVLLLKENQIEGPIPQQICRLRRLGIVDLSGNKLNGSIPLCLGNMSFGNADNDVDRYILHRMRLYGWYKYLFSPGVFYNATLEYSLFTGTDMMSEGQVEVEFTTKSRSNTYKGDILNFMFGLDLSSNKLTGDIPLQIGDLRRIRGLNLSRNGLTGLIPETISHLRLLESLDLSYNLLSGEIPSQLSELSYLAIFNVSFNNLSGTTPTKNQFATFSADSYLGNPYLCGYFPGNNCLSVTSPSAEPDAELDKEDKDETSIDMTAFYWSFIASYITILMGFVIILWINPGWRKRWFRFVNVCCSYLHKYIWRSSDVEATS